jgi:hypothetical protein
MWKARQELAAFRAGEAEWQGLLEIAREMGKVARQRQELPGLLATMRYFTEAYVGLQQLDRAVAAQELVVEIARHLDDRSLQDEENELQRLLGMGPLIGDV